MKARSLPTVALIDADNTMYDWIRYFAASLRSAVYELCAQTGVPMSELQTLLRRIYREHGTVEYAYYLEDLRSSKGLELTAQTVRAVTEAFRIREEHVLRPYPGVERGLGSLRSEGVRNVCVSDASRYHVLTRLDHLNLVQHFDVVYCVVDYSVEARFARRRQRRLRDIFQRFPKLRVEQFPIGIRKPSPDLLPLVLSDLSIDAADCVLLGDNLSKDVAMAKERSVFDCWAEYGLPRLTPDVSLLVSVTDWSASDVERFYSNRPEKLGIAPSMTAKSFEHFSSWVLRRWTSRQYSNGVSAPGVQLTPSNKQLRLLDLPGVPI